MTNNNSKNTSGVQPPIYAGISMRATTVFGGVNSCVEVGVDTWGLASGDGNNNKEIDNIDKNDIWLPNRGQVGYNIGDFNMDGQVNTSDKVVYWEPNSGKGSKIPD